MEDSKNERELNQASGGFQKVSQDFHEYRDKSIFASRLLKLLRLVFKK
ncbi:MAG: hypothetical protein AAF518_01975 [Spirochaetota bacterium]